MDVLRLPARRKRAGPSPQAPEIQRADPPRAAVLIGIEELAGSVDPDHVIRELMDNWPGLERLLIRHGAFYPLIDKVRRIRNSVEHHSDTFTKTEKVYRRAMVSIGMLERAVRSSGAEEGRRRRREAESALAGQQRPQAPSTSQRELKESRREMSA